MLENALMAIFAFLVLFLFFALVAFVKWVRDKK